MSSWITSALLRFSPQWSLIPFALRSHNSNNVLSHSSLQVRHATKKAAGSTQNGRKSAGRRLGVKVFGSQLCKAGSIIVRQRGKKFHAGANVGMGKDHTIFSKVAGIVRFSTERTKTGRQYVYVEPIQES